MIQNMNLDIELKMFIYEIAETCLKEGLFLGTKMSGKFNTSAWLCHTYHVGECCASLANMVGLDSDKARTYGMLHDYGRKKEQSFNHTLQGYEDLILSKTGLVVNAYFSASKIKWIFHSIKRIKSRRIKRFPKSYKNIRWTN